MPNLLVTVTIERDGQVLAGFPVIRRVTTAEAETEYVSKAGGDTAGVYTTIPGTSVSPALQVLFCSSDQAVNLKTASVSTADGVIALQANGFVLIFNGNIAAGAALNAMVNNVGASAANLQVATAGT